MQIKAFFDTDTYTLTYIVSGPSTKDALIIDPVWDYDPKTSKTSTESVEKVVNYIKENELNPLYTLETHAHADHLSGSQVLKEHFPNILVGIGANITKVQKTFQNIFNLATDFNIEGAQFDLLLEEGNDFQVGSLIVKTLNTPGHTPACSSYLIEDAVFTGDVLFMHDYGTGRCDFPAGSAEEMYDSITTKLYTLPDTTKVYVGHDYLPNGREVKYESTIVLEKEHNPQLNANTTKEAFINFRTERDRQLAAPNLLFQSVQINIGGGHCPQKETNGIAYLKTPFNLNG